jgi:NADH-quinone oxidoreductase subunit J
VEQLVFYLFAIVAVSSALFVVLQRRAIYSALALIVCFFSMAILFYQLGAYFIAAIQVIVYAGAIMVLFLFVVMLIDPESEVFALSRARNLSLVALPLAALFGLLVFLGVSGLGLDETGTGAAASISKGEVKEIARVLFSDYLLPFEVTSILILVAVLGAMVLAKRTD